MDPMSLANALVYTFMTEGIPVVYYGTEQGFTGSADPDNREPLWPSAYSTSSMAYRTIASLNQFRNYLVSNATAQPWIHQNSTIVSTGNGQVEIVVNKGGVISVMNTLGSPPSNHTTLIPTTGYTSNTVLVECVFADSVLLGIVMLILALKCPVVSEIPRCVQRRTRDHVRRRRTSSRTPTSFKSLPRRR